MCTPWTLTRISRWRVRDWALSFLACGFTLDVEPSSNQVSIRTTVPKTKGHCRSYNRETGKKVARRGNKSNHDKKLVQDSTRLTNESCWPQFSDEDYIVFCFREDGAFDVVKLRALNYSGKKQVRNLRHKNKHVCRDDAGEVHGYRYIGDNKPNATDENEDYYPITDDHVFFDHEEEEEKTMFIDSEDSPSSRRGAELVNVVDRTVSLESSGSNHSDGSTSSFAFPILRWEWIGSPTKMPRAENLPLRKHKERCVHLQCCKFQ